MAPAPDWSLDPDTGRRAPDRSYCFAVDHRDTSAVGNVKYVWELSRHEHLTVAGGRLPPRWRRAVRRGRGHAARSWWAANPFLSGIHWTAASSSACACCPGSGSGGCSDGWAGTGPLSRATAPSCSSSITTRSGWLGCRATVVGQQPPLAEMAGQFAAGCAFPWFPESGAWREAAATTLRRELAAADVCQRPEPRAGHRLPRLRARARTAAAPRGQLAAIRSATRSGIRFGA